MVSVITYWAKASDPGAGAASDATKHAIGSGFNHCSVRVIQPIYGRQCFGCNRQGAPHACEVVR